MTWVSWGLVLTSILSGNFARADEKLIDRLRVPNSGFQCQQFEGGNLCSTTKAPGFSGPVSFFVGNNVTRPDKIAVQFHGLQGQWAHDGSPESMIRGFGFANAIRNSGPNSILVFPFDSSGGVDGLVQLAGRFQPFMNWVKTKTGAQDPRVMVAGHSAGINALQALAKNSKAMKDISGLAAFDPVYLRDSSGFVKSDWRKALAANPKLKLYCSYRPRTTHARGVCEAMADLGGTAEETATRNHWQAVTESIDTALQLATGGGTQLATGGRPTEAAGSTTQIPNTKPFIDGITVTVPTHPARK